MGNPCYVPILKLKQGEKSALEQLQGSVKDGVWPLLNMMSDETPAEALKQMRQAWGPGRPLYIDFHKNYIHPGCISLESFITDLVRESQLVGVVVVPVTTPSRTATYNQAIEQIGQSNNTGIALRVQAGNAAADARLLSSALNTPNSLIDLIIDLEDMAGLTEALTSTVINHLVNQLHPLQALGFRRIILGGGSFPTGLTGTPARQTSQRPRKEWAIWQQVRLQHPYVIFADYGVDDGEDFEYTEGARIVPTIRYTHGEHWHIVRGFYNPRRPRDFPQFHDLARTLVANAIFCGQGFSTGDKYIFDIAQTACAGKGCRHGNLTTWVTVALNHHITYVVHQVSSLPLPSGTP